MRISDWSQTCALPILIGAGIFVLTGITAATQAGPAVVISFLIAGFACACAALSYAELASSVGGAGSAYGYGYASLGELPARSEEHTSELQSLMRISYAVFCLKKKNNTHNITHTNHHRPTHYHKREAQITTL